MKNRIKNLSYFVKRLKDNGYIVWKIMDSYNVGDTRKWTVLVNPGMESVFITCYINDSELDYNAVFEFDGGHLRFNNNIKIQTHSMEVIINYLIENDVTGDSNLFKHKNKLNNYDGKQK